MFKRGFANQAARDCLKSRIKKLSQEDGWKTISDGHFVKEFQIKPGSGLASHGPKEAIKANVYIGRQTVSIDPNEYVVYVIYFDKDDIILTDPVIIEQFGIGEGEYGYGSETDMTEDETTVHYAKDFVNKFTKGANMLKHHSAFDRKAQKDYTNTTRSTPGDIKLSYDRIVEDFNELGYEKLEEDPGDYYILNGKYSFGINPDGSVYLIQFDNTGMEIGEHINVSSADDAARKIKRS